MNYQAHYDRLIDRARSRTLSGYVERHHVIPKCLGGSDKAGNKVILTAEEHYLAHLLLVKINPENHRLAYAARVMTADAHGGRRNNKHYGWVRRRFAEASRALNTGKKESPETRARKSAATKGIPKSEEHNQKNRISHLGEKNHRFGKHHSEERKAKMSAVLKGRHHTKETIEKMKARQAERDPSTYLRGIDNPFFGRHHTEESKAILSAQHKGRPLSPEHRAKIAAGGMGKTASIETRQKISAALKGRVITPEWRMKISIAARMKRDAKENASCQVM
jgi:hypothetical protein